MKNGELRERGVMLLELKMNGPPSGCCQLFKKIASVVHPEAPELSYFSGGTAEALRSADQKNEISVDNDEDESGKLQGKRFRLMQTWGISDVEKVGQMLDWKAVLLRLIEMPDEWWDLASAMRSLSVKAIKLDGLEGLVAARTRSEAPSEKQLRTPDADIKHGRIQRHIALLDNCFGNHPLNRVNPGFTAELFTKHTMVQKQETVFVT
ncbi:unnamed protein product, partial [Mesorhabditis spiculigera]